MGTGGGWGRGQGTWAGGRWGCGTPAAGSGLSQGHPRSVLPILGEALREGVGTGPGGLLGGRLIHSVRAVLPGGLGWTWRAALSGGLGGTLCRRQQVGPVKAGGARAAGLPAVLGLSRAPVSGADVVRGWPPVPVSRAAFKRKVRLWEGSSGPRGVGAEPGGGGLAPGWCVCVCVHAQWTEKGGRDRAPRPRPVKGGTGLGGACQPTSLPPAAPPGLRGRHTHPRAGPPPRLPQATPRGAGHARPAASAPAGVVAAGRPRGRAPRWPRVCPAPWKPDAAPGCTSVLGFSLHFSGKLNFLSLDKSCQEFISPRKDQKT